MAGSKYSLIPCGILDDIILEPNLRVSLTKSGRAFSQRELSIWAGSGPICWIMNNAAVGP